MAQIEKEFACNTGDFGSILNQKDPLEKGMATHSRKIPWTEEPCRLQSIGFQRARHDWSDLAHMLSQVDKNMSCRIILCRSKFQLIYLAAGYIGQIISHICSSIVFIWKSGP